MSGNTSEWVREICRLLRKAGTFLWISEVYITCIWIPFISCSIHMHPPDHVKLSEHDLKHSSELPTRTNPRVSCGQIQTPTKFSGDGSSSNRFWPQQNTNLSDAQEISFCLMSESSVFHRSENSCCSKQTYFGDILPAQAGRMALCTPEN